MYVNTIQIMTGCSGSLVISSPFKLMYTDNGELAKHKDYKNKIRSTS